jgi:tRNA-splicing ligase RtcB (3'-phosphate/5'-hydroxy nucleic acid ligase)
MTFEILKKGQTKAPIRSWLPPYEISPDTYQQLENAANHPTVGDAVASMPDAHVGYGVSIGCVFPTVNAVIPNAVGVDIGCGVGAVDTGLIFDAERMDKAFWQSWADDVQQAVPTGFSAHREPKDLSDLNRDLRAKELQPLIEQKAMVQMGTLGGGNHFLEAQVDERGHIWLMVHSGSRHTGLRIANFYHRLATELTGKESTKDLAFLRLDDKTGQDYLHDMEWATTFAVRSRFKMLDAMLAGLEIAADHDLHHAWDSWIDCRHNYAELEEHNGRKQMVHRKGATNANLDQLAIIPGSMGTNSFIVKGKGNPDSLESCSHGAGRTMGRGAAKRAISQEDFEHSIKGTFSKASMGYVDESPLAYKDIGIVMDRQSDLIDIVHTLTPIMTLKGSSKARDD